MAGGRLRWRCRRGSRELEILLLAYLEQSYPHADAAEQAAFERLLELPEDRLQHALLGREVAPEPEMATLVRQIHNTRQSAA
jgi:antitoxin CptB